MTHVTAASGFQATGDDAPSHKVRGYWRTVGYRLRYDYVTLFFAFVIVLIALAVANRQTVVVSFDPFDATQPALAIPVPLFALMLALATAGVIIGVTRASSRRTPARARRNGLTCRPRRPLLQG